MVQKVIVELEVDESGAVKSVKNLNKEIEQVSDTAKKSTKEAKGLSKAFNGVGKAIKGVGTALKAAGIGIIIGLVSKLTEVLLQNQQVADTISKVFNTISIVFNQLVQPVIKFSKGLTTATEKFDALGKVIKAVLDIALVPFRNAILQIEGAIIAAQLIWEKSFLGGGDEDRIQELTNQLNEVGEKIVDNFKSIGENAGVIVDNFSEAVTEAGDLFTGFKDAVVDGFNNIDLAAAASGAAAIDAAKKRQEFLEIEQQALRERADRDAEVQRQIRDDVTKTLEVRIAANQKLGEILEKQNDQEQKNIQQRIANIELQNNLLGETQERNVEIFRLQTELEEVQARVTGFQSEQLTNQNSLLRERLEIERSIAETSLEAEEITKRTAIELEENEALRIEKTLQLEQQLFDTRIRFLDERLQKEREGTAEYVNILNEQAIATATFESNRKKLEEQAGKVRINTERQIQTAKVSIIASALNTAAQLAEQGTGLAKGLAVAQVTFDTIRGIQAAFASNAANAGATVVTGGAFPFIQAAAAAAFGAANIAKILSTDTSIKSIGSGSTTAASISGGSNSSGGAGPSVPSIGQAIGIVAPQGNQNIGQEILQGLNGQPIRAFSVGQDVSNQLQLDREIQANGSFGG